MTDEKKPLPVAKPPRLRVLVGLLAIIIIVIAGRSIWQQVPTALPEVGQAVGSGSKTARRAPSFDMSQATIPTERIRRGGPPKDGIPSLTDAKFLSADKAQYLAPEDRVIGVAFAGEAKAYPLKILDYHEAVNDRLGNRSFAVTYCPLCDSSAVFERQYGDELLEFGISGLLFNSNVLLYDRAKQGPESLWSQMAAAAVTSAKSGQRLQRLPLEVTTWSDWATRHPQSLVLSTDTGHNRNYQRGAYQSYFSTPDLMFPVAPIDKRLPPKTPVLGVSSKKAQRAYALPNFAWKQGGQFEDEFDGKPITLYFDPEHNSLRLVQAPEDVEWMYSFWFAWAAFYPETDIYGSTPEQAAK